MTIVPIKNAIVIKELIDKKLKEIDEDDCNLTVVSKLLEIIIKNGRGNIGFHSGLEEKKWKME